MIYEYVRWQTFILLAQTAGSIIIVSLAQPNASFVAMAHTRAHWLDAPLFIYRLPFDHHGTAAVLCCKGETLSHLNGSCYIWAKLVCIIEGRERDAICSIVCLEF